ncbi:helix-turn-helix domain-containing protein [Psychrobacter sp. I-STPA10]|uniref:helix-turn-helix domain-containing protein n=1 Tax=Psychrobacter sp. I-STPA10 TaxID=2585769 RepID=UPI001E49A12E|nr:helix-turn-helix domain-containing protein [Psychrobacter sp. I-STPA10]
MIPKKPWAQYTEQEKEIMRTAVMHAPPDAPFSPEYAAAYLGKSSSTLQYMRCHQSDGIKFSKVGRHVLYKKKHLDEYINNCEQQCTA